MMAAQVANQSDVEALSASENSFKSSFLDDAVESVNKQVDGDIKTLLEAFDAIINLTRVCIAASAIFYSQRMRNRSRIRTVYGSLRSAWKLKLERTQW